MKEQERDVDSRESTLDNRGGVFMGELSEEESEQDTFSRIEDSGGTRRDIDADSSYSGRTVNIIEESNGFSEYAGLSEQRVLDIKWGGEDRWDRISSETDARTSSGKDLTAGLLRVNKAQRAKSREGERGESEEGDGGSSGSHLRHRKNAGNGEVSEESWKLRPKVGWVMFSEGKMYDCREGSHENGSGEEMEGGIQQKIEVDSPEEQARKAELIMQEEEEAERRKHNMVQSAQSSSECGHTGDVGGGKAAAGSLKEFQSRQAAPAEVRGGEVNSRKSKRDTGKSRSNSGKLDEPVEQMISQSKNWEAESKLGQFTAVAEETSYAGISEPLESYSSLGRHIFPRLRRPIPNLGRDEDEIEMLDINEFGLHSFLGLPPSRPTIEGGAFGSLGFGNRSPSHSRAAVVALSPAASKANDHVVGWPLQGRVLPRQVRFEHCEKCDCSFLSSLNHRRHIRMHKKQLNAERGKEDYAELRPNLSEFMNKLEPEELADLLSLGDVQIEGLAGKEAIASLDKLLEHLKLELHVSFVCVNGYSQAYQDRIKAGSALLEMAQSEVLLSPVSVDRVFEILDLASEKTFLRGGTSVAVQRYIFQSHAAQFGLEHNNIVASVAFLLEFKLIQRWMADKDAEALRRQQALVEEEEAAQEKRAKLLEKKRQKKQRQRGSKDVKTKNGVTVSGKAVEGTELEGRWDEQVSSTSFEGRAVGAEGEGLGDEETSQAEDASGEGEEAPSGRYTELSLMEDAKEGECDEAGRDSENAIPISVNGGLFPEGVETSTREISEERDEANGEQHHGESSESATPPEERSLVTNGVGEVDHRVRPPVHSRGPFDMQASNMFDERQRRNRIRERMEGDDDGFSGQRSNYEGVGKPGRLIGEKGEKTGVGATDARRLRSEGVKKPSEFQNGYPGGRERRIGRQNHQKWGKVQQSREFPERGPLGVGRNGEEETRNLENGLSAGLRISHTHSGMRIQTSVAEVEAEDAPQAPKDSNHVDAISPPQGLSQGTSLPTRQKQSRRYEAGKNVERVTSRWEASAPQQKEENGLSSKSLPPTSQKLRTSVPSLAGRDSARAGGLLPTVRKNGLFSSIGGGGNFSQGPAMEVLPDAAASKQQSLCGKEGGGGGFHRIHPPVVTGRAENGKGISAVSQQINQGRNGERRDVFVKQQVTQNAEVNSGSSAEVGTSQNSSSRENNFNSEGWPGMVRTGGSHDTSLAEEIGRRVNPPSEGNGLKEGSETRVLPGSRLVNQVEEWPELSQKMDSPTGKIRQTALTRRGSALSSHPVGVGTMSNGHGRYEAQLAESAESEKDSVTGLQEEERNTFRSNDGNAEEMMSREITSGTLGHESVLNNCGDRPVGHDSSRTGVSKPETSIVLAADMRQGVSTHISSESSLPNAQYPVAERFYRSVLPSENEPAGVTATSTASVGQKLVRNKGRESQKTVTEEEPLVLLVGSLSVPLLGSSAQGHAWSQVSRDTSISAEDYLQHSESAAQLCTQGVVRVDAQGDGSRGGSGELQNDSRKGLQGGGVSAGQCERSGNEDRPTEVTAEVSDMRLSGPVSHASQAGKQPTGGKRTTQVWRPVRTQNTAHGDSVPVQSEAIQAGASQVPLTNERGEVMERCSVNAGQEEVDGAEREGIECGAHGVRGGEGEVVQQSLLHGPRNGGVVSERYKAVEALVAVCRDFLAMRWALAEAAAETEVFNPDTFNVEVSGKEAFVERQSQPEWAGHNSEEVAVFGDASGREEADGVQLAREGEVEEMSDVREGAAVERNDEGSHLGMQEKEMKGSDRVEVQVPDKGLGVNGEMGMQGKGESGGRNARNVRGGGRKRREDRRGGIDSAKEKGSKVAYVQKRPPG